MTWVRLLVCVCLFSFITPIAPARAAPVCANGTCAQAANPNTTNNPNTAAQDPIASAMNFDNWMAVIGGILDRVQAKDNIRIIAWGVFGIAVFFTCFQLIQAGGIFDGFHTVVLRLFIAAAVITASDPLGDLWKDTWHWGYKESASRMQGIHDEAKAKLNDVAVRWPEARMQIETLEAATKGRSSSSVRTADSQVNPTTSFFSALLPLFSGLLNLGLNGFYTFSVLASILTIILGKIVLPLVAACLAFPGSLGSSAIGTWAKTMTVAVLTGYFLPMIFGLAAFVAVVIPMTNFQVALNQVNQMSWDLSNATAAVQVTASADANVVEQAINWLGTTWVAQVMGNISKVLILIAVLPLMTLIGLIVAGNMIMRATSWLSALLGGVAANGGYSNALASTVTHMAMRMLPGAAAAGVGALGAVGGAVGRVASAGARVAGRAALQGAQSAGGAAASSARTLGTAAALSGSPRAAAAMNLNRAGASSRTLGSTGSHGFQVVAGREFGPAQQSGRTLVSGSELAQNARVQASSSGRFVSSYYGNHSGSRS